MVWICWGRAAGRCEASHPTREEAQRHAFDHYKALRRYDPQMIADRRAHRSDCKTVASRGREACDCAPPPRH